MTGFIDRNGKFYECNYFEHDETALRIFGKPLEFLAGFVKVYAGKYWVEDGYFSCMIAATDEQLKTLVELGIELDFEDLARWKNGIQGQKGNEND